MVEKIPAPVIAVLSETMPGIETHATIDRLFLYADAPGEAPDSSKSKSVKVEEWLRLVNKESDQPLSVLGRLIEGYMECVEAEADKDFLFGCESSNPKKELKKKLEVLLNNYGLSYCLGGVVSVGASVSSRALGDLIRGRDFHAIDEEFSRALGNVSSEPREAVSAACNILESLFKVYIEDEKLSMPQKQDLQGVWKVVRADLGFDPGSMQDDDLKKVLSGALSVVDGIGSFRTHASSAHGEGRKRYNLKPRHARLAINAAHTVALFVLETWDERKSRYGKR